MSESKSQVKPFEISKAMVWEAYRRVKANKGSAGVDGVTIEQYEQDLKNNLLVSSSGRTTSFNQPRQGNC